MLTKETLIKTLKEWGIDTTKHKYELRAEEYERFSEGTKYNYRFTAPGDWVACLSMSLHTNMTMENILDFIDEYWGGLSKIPKPERTVKGIETYAKRYWWGDGDDYIIYLKNLDDGRYLYCGDAEEATWEEEDDWGEIE